MKMLTMAHKYHQNYPETPHSELNRHFINIQYPHFFIRRSKKRSCFMKIIINKERESERTSHLPIKYMC